MAEGTANVNTRLLVPSQPPPYSFGQANQRLSLQPNSDYNDDDQAILRFKTRAIAVLCDSICSIIKMIVSNDPNNLMPYLVRFVAKFTTKIIKKLN